MEKPHKESCRAVRFVDSGTGNDSLINPSTSQLANQLPYILSVILIFHQLFYLLKRGAKTLVALCWHWQSQPIFEGNTPPIIMLDTLTRSCRLMLWLVAAILTGSADMSIVASDVETGKVIARLDNAHE